MPLLITGEVVSLLAPAVADAAVDTAVVVVGDRDPLFVGAADDGDGDLPLIGGCCVAAAAATGDVLVGERLDIDGGLLLLLLPSLALPAPCS